MWCIWGALLKIAWQRGAYPDVNSPLDSAKGLPDSTVMMVEMSS